MALVGDDTAFVHGLAIAAGWLFEDRVDSCLVIGADESDWLSADAMHLFDRKEILAEGAGAVLLQRATNGVRLKNIASPQVYSADRARETLVRAVRDELESGGSADALFGSCSHMNARLNCEPSIWKDWNGKRTSVRQTTGNAFTAASAWQTIAAAKKISEGAFGNAFVTVTGCNQEAIGFTLAHT
jgi:hypothetical protein